MTLFIILMNYTNIFTVDTSEVRINSDILVLYSKDWAAVWYQNLTSGGKLGYLMGYDCMSLISNFLPHWKYPEVAELYSIMANNSPVIDITNARCDVPEQADGTRAKYDPILNQGYVFGRFNNGDMKGKFNNNNDITNLMIIILILLIEYTFFSDAHNGRVTNHRTGVTTTWP